MDNFLAVIVKTLRSIGFNLRQERMERRPTTKAPCDVDNHQQPVQCTEDYILDTLGCRLPWLAPSTPGIIFSLTMDCMQ